MSTLSRVIGSVEIDKQSMLDGSISLDRTENGQFVIGQSRWGLPFVELPNYRSIMTKRPTIAERVAGLVRRMDGTPLCDECIADRLDLPSIAQASVVTSSASGTGGFERLRGPCGLCGEPGPVIRYNG